MDYEHNFYYNPKESDLEIVWTLEEPDLSYEYNMLVVWKHIPTGKFYYASDSGCSCPSPFEDFNKLEELAELTSLSFAQFQSDVEEFAHWNKDEEDRLAVEKASLIHEMKQALDIYGTPTS
jgi:hypothetical protein